MAEHLRPENKDDSSGDWTETSPQGNSDRGYLGAYTAQGQGDQAHPGPSLGCREADALSGVQGQSPARPGRLQTGGHGGRSPPGAAAPLLVLW